MTASKIKSRLSEIVGMLGFEYKGIRGGVDPFSINNFDMFYGDNDFHATSIDEVMKTPLFDGKTLAEIANDIDIIEW